MNLKDSLQKHNFHFKKKFGQNFISDTNLLYKIADAGNVTKDDVVVEIGPGAATLTSALASRAKYVIAIEIDNDLVPIINETMKEHTNFTLILGDALNMDLDQVVADAMGENTRYKVVANLPYYITTPLVMHLLEESHNIDDIVVMVQKEVAERLEAKPACKDYGSVTVAVNYYGKVKICFNVPRQMFTPRPDVDSAVISITPWVTKPIQAKSNSYLRHVIKASFGQRRKTLNNSLKTLGLDNAIVSDALAKNNIDPKRRGETLSLSEFVNLADTLLLSSQE